MRIQSILAGAIFLGVTLLGYSKSALAKSMTSDAVSGQLESSDQGLTSSNATYEIYPFRGEAGDRFEVNLISPDFDAVIGLFSRDGIVWAKDDKSDSVSNAGMVVTLLREGAYGAGLTNTQVSGRRRYTSTLSQTKETSSKARIFTGSSVSENTNIQKERQVIISTAQACHHTIAVESERVKPTSGDLRDFGVAFSDYEYDQYRSLPLGRTRDVIITMGGVYGGADFGADVLNSPQLMRYVATAIIETCPSVGRVGFTISGGGGFNEYYGIMMDGQIEVIPCGYDRGSLRDMLVMQWGYRSCF